jgi:glycine hydroxymethyltransferase
MNKIAELTNQEFAKQRDTLNLIASENYPSPKTLNLLGSVWSNKYAEGYPGKRYYAGNLQSDEMEDYVKGLALRAYRASEDYGVNLQVLSGSPANAMVYLSILQYGDVIMSLNVANGGHISHLHPTSSWNKFFKLVNYDVKEVESNTYEIDLDDYKQKLKESNPKLVIIGFSAYPRKYEFAQMCRLAHEQGAFVLADVAHINGLIAAGLHDTPFGKDESSADFVSMTTHKTFRGPRAAMVFARSGVPDFLNHHFKDLGKKPKSLIGLVNKTVFPGTSGGPHLNKIASIGQSLLEILGEEEYPDKIDFRTYSQKIIDNCVALERGMSEGGLEIVSPTQNHLCLVKLPDNLDSLEMQQKLERVGVITNRNGIPFDNKSPWRPGGMRFGTAALTSRGLNVEHSISLGKTIAKTVFNQATEEMLREEVNKIVGQLSWWYK